MTARRQEGSLFLRETPLYVGQHNHRQGVGQQGRATAQRMTNPYGEGATCGDAAASRSLAS